ncbi:hypothetical protein M758_UG090600 [Ceratodon purpureus]|nr:hypothetical protein M758_UG090600 [Ceratodon purpureus]
MLEQGCSLSFASSSVRCGSCQLCSILQPHRGFGRTTSAGYKTVKGQVLDGEQLWALIEGLEANGLLHYTHLLTEYIGSVSFLKTVLRVVEKLRSINPNLIYVCDPVMGDDGKFYVTPELVPVYREKVFSS